MHHTVNGVSELWSPAINGLCAVQLKESPFLSTYMVQGTPARPEIERLS